MTWAAQPQAEERHRVEKASQWWRRKRRYRRANVEGKADKTGNQAKALGQLGGQSRILGSPAQVLEHGGQRQTRGLLPALGRAEETM